MLSYRMVSFPNLHKLAVKQSLDQPLRNSQSSQELLFLLEKILQMIFLTIYIMPQGILEMEIEFQESYRDSDAYECHTDEIRVFFPFLFSMIKTTAFFSQVISQPRDRP